jgi:hypothetical protein
MNEIMVQQAQEKIEAKLEQMRLEHEQKISEMHQEVNIEARMSDLLAQYGLNV